MPKPGPAKTKPADPPASMKRELIIRAAVKVFARRGYFNSRVSDIVQEVGAAQGLFYYYFRSKEDILQGIFRNAWQTLLDRVDQIDVQVEGPLNKLRSVVEYIFQTFRRNPDLMKVLIMDVPRLDLFYNEENQQLYNRFFWRLADLIKEGQGQNLVSQEVSPLVAAYILHGSVDALIRHSLYNPKFDTEAVPIEAAIDQVIQLVFKGLVQVEV